MKILKIKRIMDYIENNSSAVLNKNKIEELLGYSFDYCDKLFKENTNISIIGYHKRIMLLEILYELYSVGRTYDELADTVYWSDRTSFGKAFRSIYGMSPSEYVKLKGDDIEYIFTNIDIEYPTIEGYVYVNTLEYNRVHKNISKRQLATECDLPLHVLDFYLKRPNAYIPYNKCLNIVKAMDLKVRQLFTQRDIVLIKRIFNETSYFNKQSKQLLLTILGKQGIQFGNVSEFAFDSTGYFPTLFFQEIQYNGITYDITLAMMVRSNKAFEFDEAEFLQNVEYQLILRETNGNVLLNKNKRDSNLGKLYASMIKALVKFAYITNITSIEEVSGDTLFLSGTTYKLFENNKLNTNLISENEILTYSDEYDYQWNIIKELY
ncbi:helix-turn-helix domain-containing protein [Wukongibacter sp. M2B1]|uniref:helix-turn-helix domain-containing protein n=1 Tax=Wukongibacter sp. M2B1 TaxID=3088895 RepID=UPI003D7A31D4